MPTLILTKTITNWKVVITIIIQSNQPPINLKKHRTNLMFLTKQLFVSSFAVRFEIMAVCSQLHLKFGQIYIVCLIIRPKIKISVRKIMTRTFME